MISKTLQEYTTLQYAEFAEIEAKNAKKPVPFTVEVRADLCLQNTHQFIR